MTANKPATTPKQVLGFCWFRREDHPAGRAMMTDPDALFEHYDAWLAEAQRLEREARDKGARVIRIRFDQTSFALFCMTRRLSADAKARGAWAASEAYRRFKDRM